MPVRDVSRDKIANALQKKGIQVGAMQGGGTLLTEPILVVNQKARIIEVNNEYGISDQHGTQIGAVRQVGQSKTKKAMRVLTSYDQFMTHKLQVVDARGQVILQLTRPAKFVKSKLIVQHGNGQEVGTTPRTAASAISTSPSRLTGSRRVRSMQRIGAPGTSTSSMNTTARSATPARSTPTPPGCCCSGWVGPRAC